MSLNRFLETTGITFMDGITHTRRSTFNGARREEHTKGKYYFIPWNGV